MWHWQPTHQDSQSYILTTPMPYHSSLGRRFLSLSLSYSPVLCHRRMSNPRAYKTTWAAPGICIWGFKAGVKRTRACYYRIRQIRRFIDERSLRLLVHAFITSRLDYCNGLFANCILAVRQRLQRIQNSAARLVCAEPAFSHVTPLLRLSLIHI